MFVILMPLDDNMICLLYPCFDLMLHVAALGMIWWHARWMLGWYDEMYVMVCYDEACLDV